MPTKLLGIAAGGAFGSVMRYLIQGWAQRLTDAAWWPAGGRLFPLGTLVVNVSGCLAFGLLAALFFGRGPVAEPVRLAMLVGVLGGYTTFSSFGYETFRLLEDRQFLAAAMYVGLSNVAGIASLWIGYRVGQRAFGVL